MNTSTHNDKTGHTNPCTCELKTWQVTLKIFDNSKLAYFPQIVIFLGTNSRLASQAYLAWEGIGSTDMNRIA